ncbi:hypothetical protein AUK22_11475 [bacterium CG2_30_54_10]|nr:MAG: hypothetical protein AUK22_11475 [bacterium CG2_30_54_10]
MWVLPRERGAKISPPGSARTKVERTPEGARVRAGCGAMSAQWRYWTASEASKPHDKAARDGGAWREGCIRRACDLRFAVDRVAFGGRWLDNHGREIRPSLG